VCLSTVQLQRDSLEVPILISKKHGFGWFKEDKQFWKSSMTISSIDVKGAVIPLNIDHMG
jgi:hypothetical protein